MVRPTLLLAKTNAAAAVTMMLCFLLAGMSANNLLPSLPAAAVVLDAAILSRGGCSEFPSRAVQDNLSIFPMAFISSSRAKSNRSDGAVSS